jgi:DNA-binding winged helix-turn-helix (wHTH) protein/tetratricopeptide (TPR) repeat protein
MIASVTFEAGKTYRFGPFELDTANAELRRDGMAVKLAPQPFTVLQALVDRPGALVTRDELRRTVWGDAHHVDFNAGLNFCLAQIRTALGESTADPIYISTVPRRGYKFIAPIEVLTAGAPLPVDAPLMAPSSSVATDPGLPAPPPRRHHWVRWAALAAMASASVAGVTIWKSALVAARPPESSSLAAVPAFERGALDLADASPEELLSRVQFFEAAIGHDPQFARAYAGLAESQLMLAEYRGDEPQRAYAMAKASAQRALALNPDLAEAHAVMAAVLWQFNWDWPGAERHLRQAQRGSASPMVLVWTSRFRSAQGRADQAIGLAERAVALAPRSPRSHVNLGMAAIYAGDYARAVSACQRATALIARFTPADMCMVTAAAETGQLPLALRHARAVLTATGDPDTAVDAVPADADQASFDSLWRARLAVLERHRASCQCDHDALSLALVYARLGQSEPALTWLERAADLHADGLVYAAVHPALRLLRGDARFRVLLDKVGAPPSTVRVADRR